MVQQPAFLKVYLQQPPFLLALLELEIFVHWVSHTRLKIVMGFLEARISCVERSEHLGLKLSSPMQTDAWRCNQLKTDQYTFTNNPRTEVDIQ